MEVENLKTASTYVNNLLLSRGLLRNGEPIDFHKASAPGSEGKNGVIANIINLVHDLVLRRDRETDSLSAVSQTLTQLRTASSQQSQTVSRLETRNAELERQVVQIESQAQTARTSLKSAETANRSLREEATRLKSSVAQIRTLCANDVRKRDAEIKRLQKYLETRRGGNAQIGVTIVTPGVSKAHSSAPGISSDSNSSSASSGHYSLKEEANDFLTQLAQNLSEENESLTSLVQMTLSTLRSLQGLPDPSLYNSETDPSVTSTAPASYETLATDMDDVLEALRSLLTNPSFVPLEEVQIREDEIQRLRAAFEKIEGKWREAVSLMDGWRRRMLDSGGAVDLEDLRRGLSLGSEKDLSKSTWEVVRGSTRSSEVPPAFTETETKSKKHQHEDQDPQQRVRKRVRLRAPTPTTTTHMDLEDAEFRAECELAANEVSPIGKTEEPLYPVLSKAPTKSPSNKSAAPSSNRRTSSRTNLTKLPPLRPTSGNARRHVSIHANSPAVGAIVAALSSEEDDDMNLDGVLDPENTVLGKHNPHQEGMPDDFNAEIASDDDIALLEAEAFRQPNDIESKKLSVKQKLELAEREAEQALEKKERKERRRSSRVVKQDERRKSEVEAEEKKTGLAERTATREGKKTTRPATTGVSGSASKKRKAEEPRIEEEKPAKRTAIPRRLGKSKRRSTLSPAELEGLMGI